MMMYTINILLFLLVLDTVFCATLHQLYKRLQEKRKIQRFHDRADRLLTPSILHPHAHRATPGKNRIGYFRGKPFYSRQDTEFIDDNGVPVPVMHYNEKGVYRGHRLGPTYNTNFEA